MLTLIGWWTFLEPSEPFLLAVWMFLMVGILFFFPTVLRHMHIDSLRKMIREGKTETPLGRYQLVLEEDGLHYVTEASEGYLRWATMGEVVKTGGYAYIYCNASSAIVIPEDTFKSKVAFDDFVAQATQYQQRSAEEVHGHPRET
ncbi:MAG: YcxB family protein [Bacteroidota bacterium]